MELDRDVKMRDDALKQSPAGKQVVLDMAREALGQSEEKYRTILEDMKEGYWEIDLAGNLTFFNDAICRLLGYSKKELLGTNYRVFTTAEDADKVYKAFNQVYRTGKPTRNMFFTISLKDGSKRFAETSVFPRRNDKGEIIGFRGASRDITERRQAEEALQAEKNKLQSLIGAMEDGLTIRDTDYNLIYQNEPSMITSGGDHAGEKCYRALEGREKVCDGCPAEEAFRDGKSHTSERRVVLPSGEVIFWENTASPVRDAEGRIVACLEIGRNVTERKETEKALQASSQQWQTTFDAINNAVFLLDSKGMILRCNNAATTLLGKPFEEIVGGSYWEVAQGSPEPMDGCPLMRMLKSHRRETLTFPIGDRWYQATADPVLDKSGNLLGAAYVIVDITERKRAEQALADEVIRRRILVDQSRDGISVLDENGKVYEANQRFAEMLGYSPEEVRELHVWDWDTQWTREQLLEMVRSVDAAGDHFETYHRRKDGTVFDVGISTNGAVVAGQKLVFCVCRDITERKQAEEALRQSEERYRTVLEQMKEAYYEVDIAGNFTFFNNAMCRQLGYSREELMGMNYRVYTPKDNVQRMYKAFNQVYRTGRLITGFPMERIRKDGTRIFAESSVFPLRNESGEIIGFRGIVRDITERKQAEEEKRQMEQKAQLASRLASVGELASGVAHEINNPLTGVIGYAHLLLTRKDMPQDIRHDLETINEGAQRVAGIVRKLLTFAGQQKPEQRFANINEIISTTLDLRAYELASNNIRVAFQPARDLPMTIVDPGQLQQVFLNLIINAETEMKLAHGRGKLSIKTEHIGNKIRISFKDNGPGIAKENLEKIFNPFFTTREVGQGTGLGLNLCHGIITEHKGRIWAESRLGRGATFFVELPIVTEDRQSVLLEPPAKEPERVTKAKILVIDDEPLVRQLVSRVLSEEGHEVEAVDNAEDALKRIKSKRYSRILLDIKMPGMGGINLYKQLQEIAPSLKKRVVFVTGDVMGKRTTDFLAKTKAPYITKPFDTEKLKTEINRILVIR